MVPFYLPFSTFSISSLKYTWVNKKDLKDNFVVYTTKMSPPEPEELEIFPCLLNQGAMLPGESQALLLPQFSAVAQSCLTLCDPMHCSMPGLPVHHQLPEFNSNSCPLSWWCHPTISSSVVPISSCLQSFPASGSFQVSQLFTSGGKVLEFQLQHQSFQRKFRADFLYGLVGFTY